MNSGATVSKICLHITSVGLRGMMCCAHPQQECKVYSMACSWAVSHIGAAGSMHHPPPVLLSYVLHRIVLYSVKVVLMACFADYLTGRCSCGLQPCSETDAKD